MLHSILAQVSPSTIRPTSSLSYTLSCLSLSLSPARQPHRAGLRAGRTHRGQEAHGAEDSARRTYSEDIIAIFHTHTDEVTLGLIHLLHPLLLVLPIPIEVITESTYPT